MRDASLDDFLSGSDETAEGDEPSSESEAEAVEEESEPEPVEEESEAEPEDEPEPERESEPEPEDESEPGRPPPIAEGDPARSTFAWSPDGATCAACGESVEERWESEVGLVCAACKEW